MPEDKTNKLPDDSALRLELMMKPDINRSIGTDKPKRVKRKNPNASSPLHTPVTYANRGALKWLL